MLLINNLLVRAKVNLKNIAEQVSYLLSGKRLLAYDELVKLVEDGIINAPIENINGTSIDLTLHHIIRTEDTGCDHRSVRLYAGESIKTIERDIKGSHHDMWPGAVVLGATVEYFNMPLDLSAEVSLKSSIGRSFLAHMLAGWVDPGFSGTITLELKNDNQFHSLAIAPGMKLCQAKFFRHRPVPFSKSYAVKGQYNGQSKVQESKGIK
jgi:dCTP deaminase